MTGADFQDYKFGPWTIHASEVFVTSPLSYGFVNLKPVVPGHVLVSPKRVVARFAELSPEEVADLWCLSQRVGVALQPHHSADSLTLTIQDGPSSGQTVPHVHVHILPRKPGDFEQNDQVYDAIDEASKALPRGGDHLDLDKERKPRTPEEMAAEAAELRKLFHVSYNSGSSSSKHLPAWVCLGFVGEGGSSMAGAYYSSDFSWESRVGEGQQALARQQRELAEWQQQQQQQRQENRKLEQHEGHQQLQQPALGPLTDAATLPTLEAGPAPVHELPAAAGATLLGQNQMGDSPADASVGPLLAEYDRGSWEEFHSTHSEARFFKERRYLLLEFPQLAVADPPQHFVEIGCGCGSSLLPVLRANPICRVTGCDISPTAVRLFLEAAARSGIDPARVSAFAWDAAEPACGAGSLTSPTMPRASIAELQPGASSNGHDFPSPASGVAAMSGTGCGSLGTIETHQEASAPPASGSSKGSYSASPLDGLGADAALLIFTLSALAPHEMPAMLRCAWGALQPGGLLLFRDYGRFDMAQLRFHGSQMLGEHLYRRGDGTLAYFFTPEGLSRLVEAAGFETVECEYACVALRNRKEGGPDMRRVFVHGVFRKPTG
ncbi:hypothetical protein N2152v2_004716 [Parachlorella kessleri]